MTRPTAAEQLVEYALELDALGRQVLPGDHQAARKLVEKLQARVRAGCRKCDHVATTTGRVSWIPNLDLLACTDCAQQAVADDPPLPWCSLCWTEVDPEDDWSAAIWDRCLILAQLCADCSGPEVRS